MEQSYLKINIFFSLETFNNKITLWLKCLCLAQKIQATKKRKIPFNA